MSSESIAARSESASSRNACAHVVCPSFAASKAKTGSRRQLSSFATRTPSRFWSVTSPACERLTSLSLRDWLSPCWITDTTLAPRRPRKKGDSFWTIGEIAARRPPHWGSLGVPPGGGGVPHGVRKGYSRPVPLSIRLALG